MQIINAHTDFPFTVATDGRGGWTKVSTDVKCTKLAMVYVDEDDGAELRVYFDRRTWNVDRDGLIYMDTRFLRGVKERLENRGISTRTMDYSEQGMQGYNYVSFDVGTNTVEDLKKKGTPVLRYDQETRRWVEVKDAKK